MCMYIQIGRLEDRYPSFLFPLCFSFISVKTKKNFCPPTLTHFFFRHVLFFFFIYIFYFVASIILTNSGLREAPPTRNPLMSAIL